MKEEHCDSGQGFLFARPLDLEACDVFLKDWIGDSASLDTDADVTDITARASDGPPAAPDVFRVTVADLPPSV